jgi:hypothetical protein
MDWLKGKPTEHFCVAHMYPSKTYGVFLQITLRSNLRNMGMGSWHSNLHNRIALVLGPISVEPCHIGNKTVHKTNWWRFMMERYRKHTRKAKAHDSPRSNLTLLNCGSRIQTQATTMWVCLKIVYPIFQQTIIMFSVKNAIFVSIYPILPDKQMLFSMSLLLSIQLRNAQEGARLWVWPSMTLWWLYSIYNKPYQPLRSHLYSHYSPSKGFPHQIKPCVLQCPAWFSRLISRICPLMSNSACRVPAIWGSIVNMGETMI